MGVLGIAFIKMGVLGIAFIKSYIADSLSAFGIGTGY
jgi:hypothetical protein